MYIIRCLFLALVIAMVTAQYTKDTMKKRETKAMCICEDGEEGKEYLGDCPPHGTYDLYCGQARPGFVCCKES